MKHGWLATLATGLVLALSGCSGTTADSTDTGPNEDVLFEDSQESDASRQPLDLLGELSDKELEESDLPSTDILADVQANDVVGDNVQEPDAEQDIPAGTSSLDIKGPTSWQRGPVSVFADCVIAPAHVPATLSLNYSLDGEHFYPATRMEVPGEDPTDVSTGTVRLVWDSLADTQTDVDAAQLQVVLSLGGDGGVLAAMTGPFYLGNRLNRDRTVLVSHYFGAEGMVRPLLFSHDTGLSLHGNPMVVGPRPIRFVMDPSGKAAVLMDDEEYVLRFFRIHEDGSLESGPVLETGMYFVDGFYTQDGGTLVLLNGNSTSDAGTWKLEVDPLTGLPEGEFDGSMIRSHYVANRVVALPGGRGYVTISGLTGEEALTALHMEIVSLDGELLGETLFGDDGSIATGIAARADGDGYLILSLYYNLFGYADSLVLFEVGSDFTIEQADRADVTDPEDVQFTSDGWHAVLSEVQGDRITGVELASNPLGLTVMNRFPMGLAMSMDSPELGPDADRFFVATVSASTGESGLGIVTLEDGVYEQHPTFILGTGSEHIPGAVAVQP